MHPIQVIPILDAFKERRASYEKMLHLNVGGFILLVGLRTNTIN
jgi:hypothetical protein